ncbi:MAG: ribonuclease D [Anaerolineales bacterium]
MSLQHLPPPSWIDTARSLRELTEDLHAQPYIGLDTESNSLFAYRERICLIQLSAGGHDYIIDPLAIDDMTPLGELLANPAVEIIFHAAEYDLLSLERNFGFRVQTLFDTMQAGRVLGVAKVGLGDMLHTHFGVSVDKRYQRANWGQRPIPPEQLRYAQVDTHYLIPLRHILYNALAEQDALGEAEEIFAESLRFEPRPASFDPDGYWKISGARRLKARQAARLRELYLWREAIAEKRDVPVFKVLGNNVLLKLARANPTKLRHLSERGLLSSKEIARYGPGIIKAVQRGNEARPPKRPRQTKADHTLIHRHDRLKAWRKQRAAQRGVESDIIMPPDTLWEIAKSAPQSLHDLAAYTHLGPWRLQTYGQEILQILAEDREPLP